MLVVEDHLDLAETFTLYLESLGYPTVTVHDGERALEAAALSQPHVVFLDLKLPGLDGYHVAQQLRAAGSTAHLVAFTGLPDAEERARAAGFDHFLFKPVEPKRLRDLLARLDGVPRDSHAG